MSGAVLSDYDGSVLRLFLGVNLDDCYVIFYFTLQRLQVSPYIGESHLCFVPIFRLNTRSNYDYRSHLENSRSSGVFVLVI